MCGMKGSVQVMYSYIVIHIYLACCGTRLLKYLIIDPFKCEDYISAIYNCAHSKCTT